MAYFSNSGEGLAFEERFCEKCAHYKGDKDIEGGSCPIMAAHIVYQGQDGAQPVLDMLIVKRDNGEKRCLLYSEAPGQAPWDT